MIYKPTDLSPSAQTFDVEDTPIFFECKVDTSNVQARGFTIKVLDSENKVVFSSIPVEKGNELKALDIKYITIIDDLRTYVNRKFPRYTTGYNLLNTGYNGSYLKIPFSVQFADRADQVDNANTVKNSQILYSAEKPTEDTEESSSGLYRWMEVEGQGVYVPVSIYNGQEYKWSITIYQLENVNGAWSLPNNPLLYDMPLTTGTVLGSNNIRIQSVLSDEIYQDYFIQPVLINELQYDPENPTSWTYTDAGSEAQTINQNNTNRVMVKSYDMTYGYIYPNTGETGFADDMITPDNANGFRIYKRGNDTENLTAYQQVAYVCESSLDSGAYGDWSWDDVLTNPGNSFGRQTYNIETDPSGKYNVPGLDGIILIGNERIILNHQYTGAAYDSDGNYIGSPYNGIFYPQFAVTANTNDQDKVSSYDVTVTWLRTPDADSWGELMTKIVTVTTPGSPYYGQNLQIKDINENADAYGTINETPFLFVPEKPIEIYKNLYNKYQSANSYQKGDIVTYIKTGSYSSYDGSGDYTPGTIVYDENNAYYVCIKANQTESLTNTKYWNPYKTQSYYITKKDAPVNEPVTSSGELNADSWDENPYLGNTGVIFYNNALGSDDPISESTNGRLYIRHFDGLSEGMTLFKNTTDNKQKYVKIKTWNPIYNFITYDELYEFDTYQGYSSSNPSILSIDTDWAPANQVGNGTKYQIKSFFRESDENAFYFYNKPEVGIHYANSKGIDFVEGRVVSGEYAPEKSYPKDTIVSYNNKNDYSSWDEKSAYNYSDKVKAKVDNVDRYYFSLIDNNTHKTSSNDYWVDVTSSLEAISSEDSTVLYVALTNTAQGEAPTGSNIGSVWEQYIGVLFDSEGYVPAQLYSPAKKYDVGTVVLNNGLYYYVERTNENVAIPDNSSDDNIWARVTTQISNGQEYSDKYPAWGYYKEDSSYGDPGRCYTYDSTNNSWVLANGGSIDDQLYFSDGYAYDSSIATDKYTTPIDDADIYQRGQTAYKNGLLYKVIAVSAGHSLNDPTYFSRMDEAKPFTYPKGANGKKAIDSNPRKRYTMGDIVLSESAYASGSNDVKYPLLPDRYYIKINTNNDSSDNIRGYIPDSSNWQTYYGPLFDSSISSNDPYNTVVFDDGLYYIKHNIDSSIDHLLPMSNAPAYISGSSYNKNDIVIYNNNFYICTANNTMTRPGVGVIGWALYPWQIFIPEITERTLTVSADYNQQQNIQWKSAQWFLFDAYGENIIDQSDVFYDGDLSYTFHGLDGRESSASPNKYYIVRLILETYAGYRCIIDSTIETMFTVQEIPAKGLVSLTFDCDTTSVITTVTKESGFIIPSPASTATVEYDDADNGSMHISGKMEYKKVAVSIEDAVSLDQAGDIDTAAERFILQSKQTIDTTRYAGDLISIESKPSNDTTGDFAIRVEEVLKADSKEYPNDNVLKSSARIIVNPDKDNLKWVANEGASNAEGFMTVLLNDGSIEDPDGNISYKTLTGNDREFITIPVYQKEGFNVSSYDTTNYLPVSYETVKISVSSEDNSNTYFNVDFFDGTNHFNIYSPSDFSSTEMPSNKTIKQIVPPVVSYEAFKNIPIGEGSFDTVFEAATIGVSSNNDDASTEVFVNAKTSALWSDYIHVVPIGTKIGRTYDGNSDTNTDYYTQKNVQTQYGWVWSDSSQGNDSVWSDGDYIEDYHGYKDLLGSITVNGTVVESIYFDSSTEEGNGNYDPTYSTTFFKRQEKLDNRLIEREYLKDTIFTFDVDLTMDGDGYISPTLQEYGDGDPDTPVSVKAYVTKNT